MRIRTAITLIVLMVFPCLPSPAGAQKTQRVPDNIQTGLQYLLSFVGSQEDSRRRFDPEKIAPVLEFITAPKSDTVRYHAGELNGAPSAYHDFSIRKNLRDILRISYDPDIPSVITSPSSLRLTRWKQVEGKPQPLPRFWEQISDFTSPIVVTGVEHTVNTPDEHPGTYYDYDLERTMILFKFRGKNVFVSMSKQPERSNVGKKGLVIGPDRNWEYLYSGETGVGKFGLGWVRSYMYDSSGIIIYYEVDPGEPLTQIAVFKWVRAGWKDINFVKRSHIHNGLLRFAEDFKAILENPELPDPVQLARSCSDIRSLSDEQLRLVVGEHLSSIEQISRRDELLPKTTIDDLMQGQRYLNSLSRNEMENLLALVYLKQILDRGQHKRLSSLPATSKPPK